MKSKKLFAILTLVAFMITLVPVAAFAATTNVALTVPNIATGDSRQLGTIRITETEATAGGIVSGDQFTVTLPASPSTRFPAAGGPAVGQNVAVGQEISSLRIPVGSRIASAQIVNASDRSMTVRIADIAPGAARATIEVLFNNMRIGSGTGPIEVEILDLNNKVTSGKVTVANLIGAGSKISALNVASVSEGNERGIGTLRVIEDAPGSLAAGHTISLTLPDYYRWENPVATEVSIFSGFQAGAGSVQLINPVLNSSGRHQLDIRIATSNTQPIPGAFDIVGLRVRVLPDAPLGDATITVGGTNAGVSPTTIVALRKVEFQTSITALDVPVRYAGNHNVNLGKIQVKEMAAGSIIAARTIRLDVPTNAVWTQQPTIEDVAGSSGSALLGAPVWANNDRTLIYTVGPATTSATTFNFKDGKISIRANAEPGDIKVSFGGTATVMGEVVAAKVAKPLELTSAPTTVKIGVQGQAAGDIVIKEVAKDMLKYAVSGATNRTLVLEAPSGVTFDVKPSVAVTAGDLKINSDNVTVSGGVLEIPILQSSLVPAEIKVTNVKLNVNRTVSEGPLAVTVKGAAINHFGFNSIGNAYSADSVGRVVVANVITPAPGDTKAESKVTFTIDSNMYTVGSAQKMMDVAPYVKAGRTYLPVRYVAEALGVINDNIMWNQAAQTVTIMKGDRVIQLKIGSPIMKVQGIDVAMDVAPEIKGGRTMLPVRFVAQALGATIGYDEATKKVTIE